MSNLSAFPYIAERSEGTPGLWNNIFSVLSANIAAVDSTATISFPSGNTLSVFSSIDASGNLHAGNRIGVGVVPSADTVEVLTIGADSSKSDYILFHDPTGAKSSYVIGSRVGGTADGLNIYDASGSTMIASFSKQSIRFYQNVVGPVFDLGGALTGTYNAATFGTASQSTESRIQAAINQASIDHISRVYVPSSMYPYSASSVSFIYTVQMVREGGSFDVYDARAYGASGNDIADDCAPIQAAINTVNAVGSGIVYLSVGTYRLASVQTDGYTLLKIKTGVSVHGVGQGSVLKVASGLRSANTGTAVLYNHLAAIADCTFRDFTLDYNGQNNLFLSSYTLFNAGVSRLGGAGGCTNLLIDNVLFKNASGYHFIFVYGASGTGITVRNCTFTECGQSIAGNQITDHTSVFLFTDNSEVAGNNFINANVCPISTACDTEGSGQQFHDNVVQNYSTGNNIAVEFRPVRDVICHDNVFRNVLRGFRFWSAATYTLSGVKLHDNIIGLREAAAGYSAGFGIAMQPDVYQSTANAQNVAIQNNEIFGESNTSLTLITSGIQLQRCDEVLVSGNKIHDLVGEAIVVQAEATPRAMDKIQIVGNQISDVGLTSTAGNKRAIALNAFNVAGQTISDVAIRGNTIILTAPSGTTATYGVQFNDGSFPNTRIAGNTILGAATAPITKNAVIAADIFYVDGEGPYNPFNLIKATLGSRWVDISSSPRRTHYAIYAAMDGGHDVWGSQEWGTAAPTTQTHRAGDVCWNTAPAIGSSLGWICTAFGTPGTWQEFGVVAVDTDAPSFTSLGIGSGTAIGPSLRFSSESSLGIFRSGTSSLGLSYGTLLLPASSELVMTGAASLHGRVANPGGTWISSVNRTSTGVQDSTGNSSWAIVANANTGANDAITVLHCAPGGGFTTLQSFDSVGNFRVGAGTALSPSLGPTSETSLGLYRSGASRLGLSYGQFSVPDGSNTTPSIGLSSATSVGFYSSGVQTIAQSLGTLNLATNSVRLSMRTIAASALTASAANTNVAVNEVVFTIQASGASFAINSGGTTWLFNSDASAKNT